ncbi:MAG: LytTR family DNA-binding domain-containing protein [Schleiferiaceae bacterium]|jgi:two-component system LytT family response regulator|nr:LytTR family DNA-binding domain-containing protein [Schleiferiaceae bacterium]
MKKAVIIDDSERARNALKRDLEEYCPQVKVIAEAESVLSGLKLLKKTETDIVFLDIHMNDGDGFELLEILGELKAKVIFTTSSDAHAIKAFKFSATDYLLKPIDPDELIKAVEKVETADNTLLKEALEKERISKIALHTQEKIAVHKFDEIIRCESDVNYTTFYFTTSKPLLVTKTLKHYDGLLKDSGFLRVHQSHLINRDHIKEYNKQDGGYLVMSDGSRVPISSRKKAEILKLIG